MNKVMCQTMMCQAMIFLHVETIICDKHIAQHLLERAIIITYYSKLSDLDDLLVFIILCEQDLVHDRGLPLGALVRHGGGLVHVIRQHPPRPHGEQVLGVGGADLVDVVVPILNGLPHSTQSIRVQQLELASATLLQRQHRQCDCMIESCMVHGACG